MIAVTSEWSLTASAGPRISRRSQRETERRRGQQVEEICRVLVAATTVDGTPAPRRRLTAFERTQLTSARPISPSMAPIRGESSGSRRSWRPRPRMNDARARRRRVRPQVAIEVGCAAAARAGGVRRMAPRQKNRAERRRGTERPARARVTRRRKRRRRTSSACAMLRSPACRARSGPANSDGCFLPTRLGRSSMRRVGAGSRAWRATGPRSTRLPQIRNRFRWSSAARPRRPIPQARRDDGRPRGNRGRARVARSRGGAARRRPGQIHAEPERQNRDQIDDRQVR